ncbi:CDP-diacylglycerol--glycerol-3-phosphate 3-phosphatidyltransferase [Bifidobacterium dolichotidis]|uniref:CDP-diacylglycerol--glycerol-3-phosphate 3-phosphatidyltransferase n=1 Tax=Bifidobacterium dolichotidis TaxID=2306976 RepID=A0A430FT80_9BIFI|nr:CDP-alcohol phosphatidyltransferase family protein [Bifidobacterium dolichotidis]RSX56070.1 CDP-diacylglycerol--glycerol-3-phosphate 3-phosphatidyltransferase [Bifidobacterium dolichotidis]
MTSQKSRKYGPDARDIVFTVPNFISLLRILSIPVIAFLITKHLMIASLIVLAASAASDFLDGYIARTFNQVSKIGQILDPIADRLLIFFSVLALAISHVLPWWMLVLVMLRDVVLGAMTLALAQRDYGPLPVHFAGKAGTAVLMIAIVGLMVAEIDQSQAWMQTLHLMATACAIWGIGLYWTAGVIYLVQAKPLFEQAAAEDTAKRA